MLLCTIVILIITVHPVSLKLAASILVHALVDEVSLSAWFDAVHEIIAAERSGGYHGLC